MSAGLAGSGFASILIAPVDERGVFRSVDGGRSWTHALFRDRKTAAIDLALDRNNPRVIYAALWEAYRLPWQMSSGGPGSGLFKSTDGGDTWAEITRNPGMPGGVPSVGSASRCRRRLESLHAPVENENGGVFRSDDAGATWTKVNDDRNLRTARLLLHAHRRRPEGSGRRLRPERRLLHINRRREIVQDAEIRTRHGDNHDLWIDPGDPKRFILSDDGGATVSVNGGRTWTDEDVPTAQLYHVATTRDVPYHVCGAQQDNTTVCVQSERSPRLFGVGPNAFAEMYQVGGGESGYVAPSLTDPNVLRREPGALLTRHDRMTGQSRDIEVYPRFFSGENAASLPDRWQWTFPIVISPFESHHLYVSSQYLYQTENDGRTWWRVSGDLTKHDPKTLGDSGGPITRDMNGPEIFGRPSRSRSPPWNPDWSGPVPTTGSCT